MILFMILSCMGFLIEILAAQFFFNQYLFIASSLHFASSVCICFSVLQLLNIHNRSEISLSCLFALLFSFLIPVSGLVIVIFFMIAIFRAHTRFYRDIELVDDSINLREIKPVTTKYGAGGAVAQLSNESRPASEGVKALFVMAEGDLSRVNLLSYKLLSDRSYEKRLLAFNILDQQESSISQDINELQDILDNSTDLKPETIARIEKNMAMLYWDFIYKRIVLNELQPAILGQAKKYALSAATVLQTDATLWALLGKVYTRLKQYDQAADAFRKTLQFNIPVSQVLPYLAEIEFRLHHYHEVVKYLNQSATLADSAIIAPVKRFWDS